MITVPTWRREIGLPPGASKEMARGAAIRRWPSQADKFARVKDDGRAEAALIAIAGLLRESRSPVRSGTARYAPERGQPPLLWIRGKTRQLSLTNRDELAGSLRCT